MNEERKALNEFYSWCIAVGEWKPTPACLRLWLRHNYPHLERDYWELYDRFQPPNPRLN